MVAMFRQLSGSLARRSPASRSRISSIATPRYSKKASPASHRKRPCGPAARACVAAISTAQADGGGRAETRRPGPQSHQPASRSPFLSALAPFPPPWNQPGSGWASALSRLTFRRDSRYILILYMNQKPHVAVVGATGAVGIEMLKTLEKRAFPVGKLTLLASARSTGKKLTFRGEQYIVTELTKDSFSGIDIALFSAGGSISQEYGPIAANAGCVVIDNSSAC